MRLPLDYNVNGINVDHDLSESLQMILEVVSNTERELEFIIDSKWFQPIVNNSHIISLLNKLKLRDISIRSVIEITKPNAAYCKKLMNCSEVRHSNNGLIGCSVKNEKELFFDFFSIGSIINNNIQQEIDFLDQPVHFFYFKINSLLINKKDIV